MLSKLFVKFIGLFGYKLFNKDLVKNQRLIDTNSTLNMSFVLDLIFKKNNINCVIQIGTNDGVRFDELKKYIKSQNIKSILVEPIKKYFEILKKTYFENKNIIYENCAIGDKTGDLDIYTVKDEYLKIYDDHIKGISSFNKNHLIKHKVKSNHITTEKVNVLTINDLMEKHNFLKVDLIYIDAEGYDGNIVINFLENCSCYPIIIFEYIHISSDIFKIVTDKLTINKYKYFRVNENLVCFKDGKYIL